MLLSSGRRPHGESKVGSRNPSGIIAGAMTQPFSKTAADTSRGNLNLDIDNWLRGIGLAQYAEMFRANDIDIELLGRLTNDATSPTPPTTPSPLQIARVEPFSEPVVDPSEQFASLPRLALVTPEAYEAHCGAQFPGLCLLLARDRKCALKICFRFRSIRLR
jgi:hypothetical protein